MAQGARRGRPLPTVEVSEGSRAPIPLFDFHLHQRVAQLGEIFRGPLVLTDLHPGPEDAKATYRAGVEVCEDQGATKDLSELRDALMQMKVE